ncbi:MAG: PEPxxWA-CTERM sorting domain-containing protein [Betaproteobacteria bacterium]|nr:PEPxxWA-CTERM sorting domain-containing protein [Betaproteobacteria bacterium]
MKSATVAAVIALSFSATPASAVQFLFDTDPFAGSDAPILAGRQIVGGPGLPLSFSTASDVFVFHTGRFGMKTLSLHNDLAPNLPASGVNVVVLRTTDNDADPLTPFGAGNAANLIADQITESAPGVFVYFNSGLNLPRLVFSPDLSDDTADLRILARMANLIGQPDSLAAFSQTNFALVPEPSEWALLLAGLGLVGAAYRRSRRRGP